jgi:hypothetical protein
MAMSCLEAKKLLAESPAKVLEGADAELLLAAFKDEAEAAEAWDGSAVWIISAFKINSNFNYFVL